MGTSQDITRREDDSGLRWYTDGNNRAMSVTTVLGFLDEDTTGLEYWKRNNQANGDDFHWSHIFWYSAPRGTLCHYHALNQFADEELWGKEERESLRQVTEGPQPSSASDCEFHDTYTDECYSCMEGALDEGASYDESDVVYSILKNQEVVDTREQFADLLENTSLSDVALRDLSWFTDTFEDVRQDLGITSQETDQSSNAKTGKEDSVIAVENFLLDSPNNYAGQCDLLYEDPSGNVVMADLKTSSGLRQKHVLQAVAYGKAVERTDGLPDTVDRHEIIRLHPDTKTYQVHTDVEPSHYPDGDNGQGDEQYTSDGWFTDDYGDYSYDSVDEMYAEFESCVEAALDSVDKE